MLVNIRLPKSTTATRAPRPYRLVLFNILTWIMQVIIQGLVMYVTGVLVALSVVPNVVRSMFAAIVANGVDVTHLPHLLGYWVFPSLFALLCMSFAYNLVMLGLWRTLKRWFGKARTWYAHRGVQVAQDVQVVQIVQDDQPIGE